MSFNTKLDISLLSKYRTQLMGVAMLWVLWFHSDLKIGIWLIDFIGRNGYAGVDVFLFLSGIGNYFSMKKDPDTLKFYKRKLLRILPILIISVFLYSIVMKVVNGESLSLFFYEVSSLSLWQNRGILPSQGFTWYVHFSILLYLMTPLILHFFNKMPFLITFIIVSVSLLVSVSIIGTDYNCFILMIIRIPAYIIGILFGYFISKKLMLSLKWILVLLCMFFIGIISIVLSYKYATPLDMWKYGYLWYPYLFITVPLSLFLSYILSLFKNYRYPILLFFGIYSLPIYLIHSWMPLFVTYFGIINSRVIVILISITISMIISYLVQNGVNKLIAKIVIEKNN